MDSSLNYLITCVLENYDSSPDVKFAIYQTISHKFFKNNIVTVFDFYFWYSPSKNKFSCNYIDEIVRGCVDILGSMYDVVCKFSDWYDRGSIDIWED